MTPSPKTQTPRRPGAGRLRTRNQISYQFLLLLMVSVAHGDAVFTLTATTPENSVGGYLPGTIVDYKVDVSQDKTTATPIRFVQMDFAASDPALSFLGEFAFDFSTLTTGMLYANFPSYPRPSSFFTGMFPSPGYMLEIPGKIPGQESDWLSLGTGQLQLPMAYGTYLLDPLNAGTTDPDEGARINFDFANPTTWSSLDGSITGSPLGLAVVPEPVTIWLVGSGLIGLVGLRRRTRKP